MTPFDGWTLHKKTWGNRGSPLKGPTSSASAGHCEDRPGTAWASEWGEVAMDAGATAGHAFLSSEPASRMDPLAVMATALIWGSR